jgi:hypothetical protein
MSSRHRYILAATVSLLCAVVLVVPAAASNDGLAGAVPADVIVNDETVKGGIVPGGRDIEHTIWFQGFLADVNSGDPISGSVDVVARIYAVASGGSSTWGPETHNAVTVTEGWFHIELGSVSLLPVFDEPPYYLELTVDGETMDARQKLASVPMAHNAEDLELPFQGSIDGVSTGFSLNSTNALNSNSTLLSQHNGLGAAVRGYHSGSGPAIMGDAAGTGLAGDFNGDVDVAGDLTTDGFMLTASPSAGHVLTSDAVGAGSWQAPASWLTLPYNETYVGTGTAFQVVHDGAPSGYAGRFLVDNSSNASDALYVRTNGGGDVIRGFQSDLFGGGGSVADFDIGFSSNASPVVDAKTPGVGPAYYGDTSGPYAVEVYSDYLSTDTHVVHAECTGTGNEHTRAVYGRSVPAGGYGFGGYFDGGHVGVYGRNSSTHSGSKWAIRGLCTGGNGTNFGVYASASGAAVNWAGYFVGDARVTGTFDNSLARLVIDHPLDPANKYLYHSVVESPDMMNVYNGNVVLDAAGEVWVELPEWFDALNRDFRYQLTAIGAPGPNLYVADKVSANRFRIAGGEPGMEVSWLVTGVRQDNYAVENRIQVEEDKPEKERGRYLHPEAYGLPRTMSVDYDEQDEKLLADESASVRRSRTVAEQAEPDDD